MSSTIEVVRGRLDDAGSAELLSFWAERRALADLEARRRLPEVVCVLRRDGEIAGVSSAYQADVAQIGGRRFWVYRNLLDQEVADQAPAMIRSTFATLEDEFDGALQSPIGLCIPIANRDERRRHAELEWSDPPAIYAGYLPDGHQLRIAYFEDALIGPSIAGSSPALNAPALHSGYRLAPFAEQQQVSARDVVDLWIREGVLAPEEAERRASEILLVAIGPDGGPAGVATAYLQRSDQLRAEVWNMRAFVATEHRLAGLARPLACAARDHLVERYRTGANTRGIGILLVVQNDFLKRFKPYARWPQLQFTFIGEDLQGSHIRVHYFPGALAPEPE